MWKNICGQNMPAFSSCAKNLTNYSSQSLSLSLSLLCSAETYSKSNQNQASKDVNSTKKTVGINLKTQSNIFTWTTTTTRTSVAVAVWWYGWIRSITKWYLGANFETFGSQRSCKTECDMQVFEIFCIW